MRAFYTLLLSCVVATHAQSCNHHSHGAPEQHVYRTFTALGKDKKPVTITGNAIIFMPAGASRTDISQIEGIKYTRAVKSALTTSTNKQCKDTKIYFCCFEDSWFINNGIKGLLGSDINLIYAKDEKQQYTDGVIVIKDGVIADHIIGTRQDVITLNTKPIIALLTKE